MVGILLSLLITFALLGFACWIVGALEIPQPFKKICLAIILFIALIVVIGMLLGGIPPYPVFTRHY